MDPCQVAPNPRMEALIRQDLPAATQKELRTPYQQQVQVPVFATHSAGIGKGAILEMIKKSQELECQTTQSPDWRGSRTGPSGSDLGKKPVSSLKGI